MLQVNGITKRYGANVVLSEVSFTLNQGDRVGLVGANGCGKSTLLRIIAGLEPPETGHVNLAPPATLGYLAQGEELDDLLQGYGDAQARFEVSGGYEVERRVESVLDGLGLGDVALNTPVVRLSGGQRTRLGLARILLLEPDLLLLDEPTNHLDIEALEWLERFLSRYRGAALVVSHDRTFLDRTVSRILELDEATHTITEYAGTYTEYATEKDRELGKQWSEWKDQQAEVHRLEEDIRRTKERALRTERSTTHDFYRRKAKKVARKAKARERRVSRLLESQDRVEKPKPAWRMKLEFGEMPRGGQVVCSLDSLGHHFGNRWLFHDVNLVLEHGERIALLGPNGSGKTTLLRAIAGELRATGGSVRIGSNVRLGYMPQGQESLDPGATPLSVFRRPPDCADVRNRGTALPPLLSVWGRRRLREGRESQLW